MKKLLALLLCLALLATLIGCANDASETTAEAETTTEQETTTEAETTTEPETTEAETTTEPETTEPEEVLENDPEAMALAFLESYFSSDYETMCRTVCPELLNDEFEVGVRETMAEFEAVDLVISQAEITQVRVANEEERAFYEWRFNREYGLSLELEDVYFLVTEYNLSMTDGSDTPNTAVVAVAKIGGQWYVLNGDESNHYGYSSPEDAALVFYEAYYAMDYEKMSTTFYPDADNDENREYFEYLLDLVAQDEFTCSNFSVTNTEKSSEEDRAEWEQTMKEEYGSEVVISELYHVEVSYDFVGTVDGEDYAETESALLPVALIDGLWYVLDGVV